MLISVYNKADKQRSESATIGLYCSRDLEPRRMILRIPRNPSNTTPPSLAATTLGLPTATAAGTSRGGSPAASPLLEAKARPLRRSESAPELLIQSQGSAAGQTTPAALRIARGGAPGPVTATKPSRRFACMLAAQLLRRQRVILTQLGVRLASGRDAALPSDAVIAHHFERITRAFDRFDRSGRSGSPQLDGLLRLRRAPDGSLRNRHSQAFGSGADWVATAGSIRPRFLLHGAPFGALEPYFATLIHERIDTVVALIPASWWPQQGSMRHGAVAVQAEATDKLFLGEPGHQVVVQQGSYT
ncbi:MAG: hypothetical protein EOO40_09565, partial [Deltaproteobacteria bacterium]